MGNDGVNPMNSVVGKRNLITDVPGVLVGNAANDEIKTGATVLSADQPFLASVDVMGGAPGTRETDCLAPENLVEDVDAIVLSGGSAFGLDAASGVTDALAEMHRGFQVGPVNVPIVPAAIIFDLINGGDKSWLENPYKQLGRDALANCSADFKLGSAGAGVGATTATLKGGLGSASLVLPSGHTVGALVVVNPHGSPVVSDTNQFWAAPFEVDNEFGGLGVSTQANPLVMPKNEKLSAYQAKSNTTIAIVATDAELDKAQAKRFAVAAQDGIARAIVPSHTLFDGDLIFGVSTRQKPLAEPDAAIVQMALGHAAAVCMSRAIARGVYMATSASNDTLPSWQSLQEKS